MNRSVTLTDLDIATAVDCGSVVVITGTDVDTQERVTFAGDTRPMLQVMEALVMDVEDEITVDVEEWQIRNVMEARA